METIKVKCDVPRELSIAAGQVKYGSLDIEITPELLVLASPETRRRLAQGWSTETETGDRDYRLRIVQWTPGHDVPTAADLAASFEAALAAEAETTAKYERAIADHVGRMSDADLASLFDPSRGEGVRYLGTRLLATWETIRRVCPDVGARIERGRAQKAAEAEARKRAEARLHAERAERAAAEKAKAEEDFAAIAAALDAADPALAPVARRARAREGRGARAPRARLRRDRAYGFLDRRGLRRVRGGAGGSRGAFPRRVREVQAGRGAPSPAPEGAARRSARV